jgi:hypothetical protein
MPTVASSHIAVILKPEKSWPGKAQESPDAFSAALQWLE